MRGLLAACAALAAAMTAGCFTPPAPDCAFACSGASALCPVGYSCRPDGLCKRVEVPDDQACPDVASDASRVDAATDAQVVDGAVIDAPPIDAPAIDAAIDAAVDAPIDASAPMLTITTAAPVAFGTQATTTTMTRPITVRNNGMTASSAIVLSITGDVGQFMLVAGGTDTCSTVALAPMTNCTFEVSFTPTLAQPYSATVTATAVTGGMPMIMVTGTGQ